MIDTEELLVELMKRELDTRISLYKGKVKVQLIDYNKKDILFSSIQDTNEAALADIIKKLVKNQKVQETDDQLSVL